jgi:hypothetical protein
MTPPHKITKAHLASYIQTCTVGVPTPAAVRADLAPFLAVESFAQDQSGTKRNYEETVEHLAKVRATVTRFSFEILDAVVDDAAGSFACRFRPCVGMEKGREVRLEIALFGRFDGEGRITFVYEMTRNLSEDVRLN